MKDIKIGIKLYVASLIIFVSLHVLVLMGILSPILLWDDTLTDTKTMIFSEVTIILTLSFILVFLIQKLSKIAKNHNRLIATRIIRLLALLFILEFLGALTGDEAIFKFFGLYYFFEFIYSIYALIQLDSLKVKKSPRVKG